MSFKCLIIAALWAAMTTFSTEALTPDGYAFASLNGNKMNPPIETNTVAGFEMREGAGDSIYWILVVKDVEELIMAHIHYGNSTTTGPPVVNLVPTNEEKAVNNSLGLQQLATPMNGTVFFQGNFTSNDFMTNLKRRNMTDFLQDLSDGNLYVNVHTVAEAAGLIRGQLEEGRYEKDDDSDDDFFNEFDDDKWQNDY